MPVTVQRVVECVRDVELTSERMVLIVGKPGSGKSRVLRELADIRGWKYLESKMLLTDEFLELPPRIRAQEAPVSISKVFGAAKADVILLDGIQLLFAPVLQLEPMELLKQLSRKYTIVVAWPGGYDNGQLSFAYNGRSDFRTYDASGLKIIQID